jgi:hypothetical protein
MFTGDAWRDFASVGISAIGVPINMKIHQVLVLCLFATTHANARNSDARIPQPDVSFSMNSDTVSGVDYAARTAPIASGMRRTARTQANLSGISGGVVKEMRATSAIVRKGVAKAETSDGWLIALAALGLIVLQLRRKHNSLPLRRITPHG